MKRQWVVFDPQDGPEFFDTPEQAKEHATEIMEAYRDDCNQDGWDESVTDLSWGEYIPHQQAVQTRCEPAPPGSEYEEYWDFDLRDVHDESEAR